PQRGAGLGVARCEGRSVAAAGRAEPGPRTGAAGKLGTLVVAWVAEVAGVFHCSIARGEKSTKRGQRATMEKVCYLCYPRPLPSPPGPFLGEHLEHDTATRRRRLDRLAPPAPARPLSGRGAGQLLRRVPGQPDGRGRGRRPHR